jgi:trimethylamine:corrinoid methyltransferase-like protein
LLTIDRSLSQLVREGAPFIRDACAGGTRYMQYMVGQQSPPQLRGFNEEMLHPYGLPGFGVGGNSGAKILDGQATLSLITSVQAGAHLIHDAGYLDNATAGSLTQMVICDEIICDGWFAAGATTLEQRARALVDEMLAQPLEERFTPHQAQAIAEITEWI